MHCRGVRGATTAEANTPEAILEATHELLLAMVAANGLVPADLAAALFTTTPDLTAAFPARAAREAGWVDVPLLDSAEIAHPTGLPLCIRVLLLWNCNLPAGAVRHVYLKGATGLRPDLVSQHLSASDSGGLTVNSLAQPAHAQPAGPLTPVIVAYQGEPGAYSQEALVQHFGPDAVALACESFEDIFAAVECSRANYGLLPVENSQAGSVHTAYELLLDRDLKVAGEVKLRVRHCLLAPEGTNVSEIRRVKSHPQALAQCEHYLRKHGWEAIPANDTAGAAHELSLHPEPGTAAIASALAGHIYDLDILEAGIEDADTNATRFFVLAQQEAPRSEKSKTSLVIATAHAPGALHRAIGEFSTRGINLTRIESRPRRNRPWHYVFYLDCDGHWQDTPVEQALVSLLSHAAYVKLLGSYPAAPEPDDFAADTSAA
jgi:prephenate dehydratase